MSVEETKVLTPNDKDALGNWSSKGFDYRKQRPITDFSDNLSLVDIGIVNSSSGYLMISELYGVKGSIERASAVDSVERSSLSGLYDRFGDTFAPPKLVQGGGVIAFRNLWGDGCFGVFRSSGNFYVETEYPLFGELDEFAREIVSGRIPTSDEGHRFEGTVGVGSGVMAIVDPEIHPPDYFKNMRDGGHHPDFSRGDFFTILRAGRGSYHCKFEQESKILSIFRS